MNKKSIKDINLNGEKVLVRVDFNVPVQEGQITDDHRIRSAVPTIRYIVEQGGIPILMSHLGRPKGQVVNQLSLKIVIPVLEEFFPHQRILFASDCIGSAVEEKVNSLQKNDILLLENTRFHSEETLNNTSFSKKLAQSGTIFVQDAFGTVHRAHSSTEGISHFTNTSVAGLLVEKEMQAFNQVLYSPQQPFLTILGGSKVSDKILLLENLIEKVNILLIGGSMSHTFLASKGYNLKDTKIESDKLNLAQSILEKAKSKGVEVVLPIDFILANEFSKTADVITSNGYEVPDGYMALDIGPQTQQLFCQHIENASVILWNGPVGVFEWEAYEKGTRCLAMALANHSGVTIIGGGDTASAVKQFDVDNKMTHVSTGGGASLELLEGKNLPGICCLDNK